MVRLFSRRKESHLIRLIKLSSRRLRDRLPYIGPRCRFDQSNLDRTQWDPRHGKLGAGQVCLYRARRNGDEESRKLD